QVCDSLTFAAWFLDADAPYDRATDSMIQSVIPMINDLAVIDFFNIFGEIFIFLHKLFLL
ncbi:MAG: hypothetical protein ACW99Q_06735, partial [Candidatus Kariarchaeaceae archaeon]